MSVIGFNELTYKYRVNHIKFLGIQGVKKFGNITLSVITSAAKTIQSKLHKFQELFNIKVSTMLELLQSYFTIIKLEVYTQVCHLLLILHIKGWFLEFRRYHNFANLFSKLSESTFYKTISKFQ